MTVHNISLQLIVKISLLAVALFTRGVWSQAPGDEDRLCMIGSYSHEYEAGVISLMDTHNYRYLLGVNEAVWHETDFDDNNNPDSYYQTSVSFAVWIMTSCRVNNYNPYNNM